MARYFVSDDDASRALKLAQDVDSGTIRRKDAITRLVNDHGFEPYTANAYIKCYGHLRTGTCWKATVSDGAVRKMLSSIALKGADDLFIALQSVQRHIDYFAELGRISAGLIALLSEFRAHLAGSANILVGRDDFEFLVERAIAEKQESRRKRLALAPTKPQFTVRLIREFTRNPDVIAEVLVRAKGICELCLKPAPFMRSRTGQPYLEVHHKVRLADGGDDTVENAVAVCPNCHRREHFG